jgi:biotin carboxylase
MAARDKSRCRRILDERGIPSVGHGVAVNASDALAVADVLGYPVVIKPATGAGKLVTSLARSPQDVDRHFAAAAAQSETLDPALLAELDGRFLVEEVAVGPLYSVEVATDGRASTPLAAVRRKVGRDNPLLELGSTMPAGLSPSAERELGDYLVQICGALGLDLGIFHAEAILTEDGFRLIEVNPRIGGGVVPDVIRAATDRNLFEILVDLYDGGAVPPQPLPARRGASNTFLGVPDHHTVRSDLPADWFEAFRPRLESGNTSIRAGLRLRPMVNNFDRYGTVQVIADDFGRAEQKCATITAELEAVVGVPFVPIAPS